MANRNDWFRNETWDEQIERDFFARLERARSRRDQYLAIQALCLSETCPGAAIRLANHYFDTRTSDFDDSRVFMARAQAHRSLGQVDEAIESYRDAIDSEQESRRFPTGSMLELPYYIAVSELADRYDLAVSLLEAGKGESIFPVAIFKWNAAMALIAHRRHQLDVAREYALGALAAAAIRETELTYHRSLGLVDDAYTPVLKKLKSIVPES